MSRRAALPAHCRRCGRLVLTGLDDDVCAFTATVDPYPADIVAETLALLSGRRTYDVHPGSNGHHELIRRTDHTIGNPRGTVVLAHDCDRPHRSDDDSIVTRLGTAAPGEPDLLTLPDDERIPF